MSRPWIVLVGGFLGAGKTTLLETASRRLAGRGARVGLITNDQAGGLVDTALLGGGRLPVAEVGGGCFCCKFDDLVGAVEHLVERGRPDVLLGEPVGSCTDLSATVIQPLKALHGERFRVGPFSVLVDPERVRAFLDGPAASTPSFPENVGYIYRKQLEEADLLVLNKVDLVPAGARDALADALRRAFPRADVVALSALDGTGVDRWLDLVTGPERSGRTIAEVDYDVYADGEAALGWFNASYRLEAGPAHDWQAFGRALTTALRRAFLAAGSEVAHLKLHLEAVAGAGRIVANLTSSLGEPSVRGCLEGGAGTVRLLLNARAHIDPDRLRRLVEGVVAEVSATSVGVVTDDVQCFAPARPRPTHRYHAVVD